MFKWKEKALAVTFVITIAAFMILGRCNLSGNIATAEEAAAPAPTFQDVASKIFGQAVGPDDSGEKYIFGLTAKYTGPENRLPAEGKLKNVFYFLPVIRWYDPDHYYTSSQEVEGVFKQEECVLCHMVQTPARR
ncbi:MAG: hypothetical protein HYW14_01875 [Planctomycetes bacterium]|nr:hypothetical protein [Planctomycetota bacterium]